MHTKDFLAQELEAAGLTDMAALARTGYYHDYLSPLTFPEMQLAEDLAVAIAAGKEGAKKLRERHLNGEFDASTEESEEWAASPDGQEAFGQLVRRDLKSEP